MKLAPVKKNGKEKRSFYRELEDDDDELDFTASKRESVLDYYDDEDGDEDWDQAAGDDSDEEEPGQFEWSEQDETSGFEEDFDVAEEDWEE
ncbi:MAG: hypothetical protein LUD68_02450 [Rikenellaceae bacterium]|nr:hypothetical protein [Rikenellaceae bacterium]